MSRPLDVGLARDEVSWPVIMTPQRARNDMIEPSNTAERTEDPALGWSTAPALWGLGVWSDASRSRDLSGAEERELRRPR